ncbi:hypothetical protein OHA21_14270 [Actinoplanes sp. NBC_00393]|uniref:hypothetical protein n=1 Tax=Actinoplanes sp. NBC_00393 TaxID=2975953 RepID=UPI002E236A9A
MRAKRYLAGVAALALAGGCAAQQVGALEPKLELRDAALQLAEAQQAGFTLKVTGSPDDLVAAAKLEPDFQQPSADDLAMLRQLFNSSVTVAYDKAGEGTADDRSSLSASVDGLTGTEIRFVDGVVYAKAPVTELAAKFGAGKREVEQLAAGAVPGLDAFFDGKWVSVDAADAVAGTLGLETGPHQQEKALAELATSATNLLDGAEVVRDGADSSHLIVTSSTTKAYTEAKRFVTAVEETLGNDLGAAPKDRPIVLDLWVDDGKLTAAEINLLQFIDGAAGRVAARIELTTGAPITAPDGATKIDVAEGMPYLMAPETSGLLGPDDIGVPGS